MKKSKPLQHIAWVGVDVGGTDLKCAVVDEKGRILQRFIRPTLADRNEEIILRNILQACSVARKWAAGKGLGIGGIGFGIPGILSKAGIVCRSPHFPAWIDYPIQRELSSRLPCPVVVDNDANMAALGEGWVGAAKQWKDYLLFTLGTGIGGGIVLDRKVFRGDSGFAGEFGHLVLNQGGYACACGGQGCLELYASATGLEKMSPFSPKKLYQLALRGDRKARKIFTCLGDSLGAGIASVVNILDVESVIVGGGLSGAWPVFSPALRRGIRRHIYPTTASRIRLARAKLGNDAGILGAAKAAWDESRRTKEEK